MVGIWSLHHSRQTIGYIICRYIQLTVEGNTAAAGHAKGQAVITLTVQEVSAIHYAWIGCTRVHVHRARFVAIGLLRNLNALKAGGHFFCIF